MYCFGVVAAFFEKAFDSDEEYKCFWFFLAKSVFAVVIVENVCYKDSSYVVLTKRENLILFLFLKEGN